MGGEVIVRAIEFQLDATKLLVIRYGESQFKKIDEFWYDFTPDGGEKTTAFSPSLVKDTPKNRELVQRIQANYAELKKITDDYSKQEYAIRNQLER